MHPIVPITMALGVILFFVGIVVQTWLGFRRINRIKLRGKEYQRWHFVFATVGSGVALIMLSVMLPKYITYEPAQDQKAMQPALSGNLKFELESILFSLNLNEDAILKAITRFQTEYQEASQRNDKSTMDILILEIAYRIRTELQNRDYPEHQIEREVEKITNVLRQSTKIENLK
ncbi:hypothetical protein [Nitrosomonas ureae]|uniref:Uncharacterized protein n=1 Tax=Nitrosomonas ureae TaxID=44577 RepID=A0A0S3AM12_9PROT|nr:hypothetical protein [Nitrosomonas ureae]ALQ52195.1 hypothetical protein ATY38_13835 [Nitrosomonas ureae]PTQ84216.1 hypothetical protein C8R28_101925 [Nitrosomonas ureae]PXX14663.1 hypothetical protein C8R27_11417 [Nitrosomonas ureae]SDU19031.1 hypothetical protein SAMN05216406_13211 [Nitrosomonas ureae]SEQ53870.1 hypothetical protein SAMN05421510_10776 [Nitrosomonas ureae]